MKGPIGQTIVSMTGFVHDPNMTKYQQMLQQIGCRYAEQLSQNVSYLIINHTCTEKYKIAKLEKSQTQCITLGWLEDSVKAGRMLPIGKYRNERLFYGVRVIMEGFEDKSVRDKVQELLKKHGVEEVKEGVQGMLMQEINQKYQLVMVPTVKLYRKLQNKIAEFLSIPLVTPQWLQQSIKAKMCKYPHDYALNYQNICSREFNDNTNVRRLKRKLDNFMQQKFLSISNSALLQDPCSGQQFILYLDPNSIEPTFRELLQKLICVNGGLYLNSYGPVVTHLLVGNVQEAEYHRFMNYGDSSHILRVEWLIDTILCVEKLPEVDFKVRSFSCVLTKSMNSLDIREASYHRSQLSQNFIHASNGFNSVHLNASLPLAPPKLDKKASKSISISKQPVKITQVVPITKTKTIKTDIFKGRYFYIDKMQRKQPTMQSVFTKIKQNGGVPLSENSLPQLRNKKLYIILKDSQKNHQYLEQISKIVSTNGITMIALSIRWVQECVKKMQYIDFNIENCFTFKPFTFETPVRELMTMKIELLGIEEVLKRRYRELLIALGTNKVSPNIYEITHCLCGKEYETDPRYLTIMNALQSSQKQKQQRQKETVTKQSSGLKTNVNTTPIKFVRVEWLMEISNKAKANMDQFMIKIEERPE